MDGIYMVQDSVRSRAGETYALPLRELRKTGRSKGDMEKKRMLERT